MADEISELRHCFDNKIIDLQLSKRTEYSMLLSQDDYVRAVERVKCAKDNPNNARHRQSRYDIIKVGDEEKLIKPITSPGDNIQYYVTTDKLFDIIHDTHIALDHPGRNRMSQELRKNYCNITKEVVMLYVSMCRHCQTRSNSNGNRKQPTPSTNLTPYLKSRAQVNLIDMSNQPCNDYNHILMYQEEETKFLFLKPLRGTSSQEIAMNLLDIFTTIGVPSILHSDKGKAFIEDIITNINAIWEEPKIVVGNPKFALEMEGVSYAVKSWLNLNPNSTWDMALKFVQFVRNCTYHSSILKSPYEAMFKCRPKLGLASSSSLTKEAMKDLTTENDIVVEMNAGLCVICSEHSLDFRRCEVCNGNVHIACGRVLQDGDGYIVGITCNNCLESGTGIDSEAKKIKLEEETNILHMD